MLTMRIRVKVLVLLLLCLAANALATYVAVLETISSNEQVGLSEKIYLTDKLREIASRTLPAYMGYTIMTRENINAMLPPGKTIEDCEGSCLAETGKNIAADYVAQGRIGAFGQQVTLTVELYETASNKLVGSFTARRPDAEGLIEEIEQKAAEIFERIKVQFPVEPTPPAEPATPAAPAVDYGIVNIDPIFTGNYGDASQLKIKVNNIVQKSGKFKLRPGTYKVSISHRCYETANLEANVTGGKKLTFKKPLEVAQATIALNVDKGGVWDDIPEPVYVDGVKVGETPFTGNVPLCGLLQVGANKETVKAPLQKGKTISYTHKMARQNSLYTAQANNAGASAPAPAPRPSGYELKLLLGFMVGETEYSASSYYGQSSNEEATTIRTGIGMEFDFYSSNRLAFGLGTSLTILYLNFDYSSTNHSYENGYSGAITKEYDFGITVTSIDITPAVALGWENLKFFLRAGFAFNVGLIANNYSGDVEKENLTYIFETGLRFAKNHEIYFGGETSAIYNVDYVGPTDGTLFAGYRYAPTIKTNRK